MTSSWLAWHEARSRRAAFLLSAALVAAAVAMSIGLELGARARESSVSSQMDRVAPGVRIVPSGINSTALRRLELGQQMLPAGLEDEVVDTLGRQLRKTETRLVLRHEVAGQSIPVIGLGPSDSAWMFIGPREASEHSIHVGFALRNRVTAGSTLSLFGRSWTVASILPQRGTLDDRSAFVARSSLQQAVGLSGKINELRLYLHSVVDIEPAAKRLRQAHSGISVYASADRRGAAEAETEESLGRYRMVLQLLTAAVVLIALFVAATLEVRGRSRDIAMLIAMGARGWTIVATLAQRFAFAGVLGAVGGLVFAAGVVIAQEPSVAFAMRWPWVDILITGTVAVGASAIAASLPGLVAVLRDHVSALSS